MLLRDLFAKAQHADRKTRARTIKDLDKAASTLADACRIILDPSLPDGDLRERVYAGIGKETLAQALADVSSLVRPSDDVFYRELEGKHATVKRFLPTLLRVITFKGNPAADQLLEALNWMRLRPQTDPPTAIVSKAWRRHVIPENGQVDQQAFTFCALDKLRVAIRRRDVFVRPSWRYGDPRVGLLAGTEWEAARPIICRSLGLTPLPAPTLAMLSQELDETYRAVATRLPSNTAVRFETIDGQPELVLSPLDKLEEPPSLVALRGIVISRMPRVDLPETLLEIAARTGCMDGFTHLTERTARTADLTTSLCAVLLAECDECRLV